jgi:hypothetical protein
MRLGKRIEAWPPALRAAIEAKMVSDEARRAIGRLLGWAEREGRSPFETETIGAFVDFLESSLQPDRRREVLGSLGHGLLALMPDKDWAWILARRRAAGPRGASTYLFSEKARWGPQTDIQPAGLRLARCFPASVAGRS